MKVSVGIYEDIIYMGFRHFQFDVNVYPSTVNINSVISTIIQIDASDVAENARVQKYFNEQWQKIKADIEGQLNDIQEQTGVQKLHIGGRDLGGAVAQIAYLDLVQSGIFGDVFITTFDSMKVGNKAWANHFNDVAEADAKRYYISSSMSSLYPVCSSVECEGENFVHAGTAIVCE